MILERFCFCYSLQRGVFLSTILSSLLWTTLGMMYIPCIIYWFPSSYDRPEDTSSPRRPDDPYKFGSLAPIIIICSLFVDTLAIAGLYKNKHIKHALLVPWLFFYPVIITVFVSIGIWNIISGLYPLYASGITAIIAGMHIYIWWTMYSIFHTDFRNKISRMEVHKEATMVPLSNRNIV
nr:uncharacterized protein LOC121119053 [Lepeophtheirus salmonis]